jgi:hypothetical protein
MRTQTLAPSPNNLPNRTAVRSYTVCRPGTYDPLGPQTQKDKDGLLDALHVFDIEMPDAASESILWYRGDLINHQSRKRVEAVALGWRNRDAEQRRLGCVGRHDADRDGFGGIEAVILENDRGPRLAGVILSPSDRPDFSTSQSVTRLQ